MCGIIFKQVMVGGKGMTLLEDLASKIKAGHLITKEETMTLLNDDLQELLKVADEIRAYFCGEEFDFCSIINGKSGKCSENCKYCAQSSHYETNTVEYEFLDTQTILADAIHHACEGVKRYSIVTSGKKLAKDDIEKACETYKCLADDLTLEICASHGLLGAQELAVLKESGVKRYHNNLETSKRFFPNICSTHTYEEKVETIKNAKEAGLEVCSGGIFGIGETMEDRIDLAFKLRELDVDSIPLNILSPIEGTPLENSQGITEDEFLRTAAIFRLVNPTKVIRLAGGRGQLKGYGENAFKGGINGTITGDLLTTCGNSIAKDRELVAELGFAIN